MDLRYEGIFIDFLSLSLFLTTNKFSLLMGRLMLYSTVEFSKANTFRRCAQQFFKNTRTASFDRHLHHIPVFAFLQRHIID